MSWEFDLASEISLTPPSKIGFPSISASDFLGMVPQTGPYYAKWRANDRTREKKLGIFSPPNVNGDIVQDLGLKSTLYPLTLYFDGINHHITADNFFKSCEESGVWEINHPVHGLMLLQLVSVQENCNPVEFGNYTQIETHWMEPAEAIGYGAGLSAIGMILAAANFILDAITQFKQLRSDLYSALTAASGTMNKLAGFADSIVKEISATSALAQESYESFRSAFTNAVNNFGIVNPDPTDMAEAFDNLISAPVTASESYSTTFATYNNYIEQIVTLTPSGATVQDVNAALALEFGISAALAAIIRLIYNSVFKSRAEIVAAMENLQDVFDSTIAALEVVQENTSENYIDKQYYSQSKAYTSLVYMFSLAMQYLISQFFNLKTEKRITTKTPRSPLEITVTEYGSLGKDDANYDLFIESNNLTGNDILILPAGKEIIIYV
jgi:prophage DNA circulation protein